MFIAEQYNFSHSRRCIFRLEWDCADLTVTSPFLLFIDLDTNSTQIEVDSTNGAAVDDNIVSYQVASTVLLESLSKNQYWLQLYATVNGVVSLVFEGLIDVTDDETTGLQNTDFVLEYDGGTYTLTKYASEAEATTPEDSNEWHRVGATDEETGLYRLPTIAFNKYGDAIDYDDNTLETRWFSAKGEVANLADILVGLIPTSNESNLPLQAQNGIAQWWKAQVETLTNAPTGLTGYADIEVIPIGKTCKVVVRNANGEVYNYTKDLGATPVVWHGWKYTPYATSLNTANKLLKGGGGQEVKQANAWEHADGTFSFGSASKYANALMSINGRVAAQDPSTNDDLVTLRRLLSQLQPYALTQALTILSNEITLRAMIDHRHNMSDIIGLFDEFQKYLNKGVFGAGQPFDVAARDENGNVIIIDMTGARLLIEELPPAQEDAAYSYTIAPSLFVWPFGAQAKEVIAVSSKTIRGGVGWMSIGTYSPSTGLAISGTPDDDEDTLLAIKMRWKMREAAKLMEQTFVLPLAVYPVSASISAPNAPSNLVATANSSSEIGISWTDNSSNESAFELDWSADGNTYQPLATKASNATTHTHSQLQGNTWYYYRLRAINSAGASSYVYGSAITPATPIPNVVLSAQGINSNTIRVEWTFSGNAEEFRLEFSTNNSTFSQVDGGIFGGGVRSHNTSPWASNVTYYFRMRAKVSGVWSAYSNVVSASALNADGFTIIDEAQVVSGANPKQSYHYVTRPVRVFNISTQPIGVYNGSVTINGVTSALNNIDTSATGYPAIRFDPRDTVWNITSAGVYNVSITLNINGVNYTRSISTTVTNEDLGITPPTGGGEYETNPNVYLRADKNTVVMRFKFGGMSGTYNVVTKQNGTTISTQNNLPVVNDTYIEISLSNTGLSGQTLVFEIVGTNASNVTYFIPDIITYEFEAEAGNWLDEVLLLRLTKNFDSNRYILADIGNNLGMNPHYQTNGSLAVVSGQPNSTVLSDVPVPAEVPIQVIKYLIDTSISNINTDGWRLFYDSPQANKWVAVLNFWIKVR